MELSKPDEKKWKVEQKDLTSTERLVAAIRRSLFTRPIAQGLS